MRQLKNNFSVVLETAEPTDRTFVKFLKDNKIKSKTIEKANKSHSGFDEILYSAESKAVLKKMIDKFWHSESLKDYIK